MYMLIILGKNNVIYLILYSNYSGRLHMLMKDVDIHICIYIFAFFVISSYKSFNE